MTDHFSDKQNTAERFLDRDGLSFVVFPALEETGLVRHGFATRKGGVSRGCFESLNLSYARGDERESVNENVRRAAAFFDITPGDMVTGWQTNTSNIRRIVKEDAGKGFTRERDYKDIDGLITDVPGVMLCTYHADCTPLFFVDPVHRAIGLSHSGWKGTWKRIGAVTIQRMHEAFATKPGDLITAIGPCACGKCYEVGEEVAEAFMDEFGAQCLEESSSRQPSRYGRRGSGVFLKALQNGKYLLDQKAANEHILLSAGVRPEHISISGLCTMERTDLFFSHRRMGNARGNGAAFLMLDSCAAAGSESRL